MLFVTHEELEKMQKKLKKRNCNLSENENISFLCLLLLDWQMKMSTETT